MAVSVRPYVTAGVAVAGAGFWLATMHGAPQPVEAAKVQLTSVEAALPLSPVSSTMCGDLLCPALVGSEKSTPTPTPLASALIGAGAGIGAAAAPVAVDNPLGALVAVFVSNGTAAHPDAGLLIGNGYDATVA